MSESSYHNENAGTATLYKNFRKLCVAVSADSHDECDRQIGGQTELLPL